MLSVTGGCFIQEKDIFYGGPRSTWQDWCWGILEAQGRLVDPPHDEWTTPLVMSKPDGQELTCGSTPDCCDVPQDDLWRLKMNISRMDATRKTVFSRESSRTRKPLRPLTRVSKSRLTLILVGMAW